MTRRAERPLRLLDVNVLVALSLPNHAHHETVTRWFDTVDRWATCSITQCAYVRLLLNPKVAGFPTSADHVREGLSALCRVSGHEFLVDDAPLTRPAIDMGGLVGHKQVTDFHLVDLASRHGAVLATLDSRLLAVLAPAVRRCVELVPV